MTARDVIDRIGDLTDWLAANPEEAKDADWRAWRQLLIYAPKSAELAALLNPWRPIETLDDRRGAVPVFDEEWSETLGEVQMARREGGRFIGDEGVELHPTAWYLLPAPPAEDKA